MTEANLQIPIIEDLVQIGIEQGRAEGVEQGRAEGTRRAITEVLIARGLTPSLEQQERLAEERDPVRLLRWLRLAASARDANDVFRG